MSALRVAPTETRPQWVDDAIASLDALERGILNVEQSLLAAVMQLRDHKLTEPADELLAAYHDAEHSWHHITSTRRGLRMSWPDEERE